MKGLIITLVLILASAATAEIASGTMYYDDMRILDLAMVSDYPDDSYYVTCAEAEDGNILIGVIFDNNWQPSDYCLGQLAYAIGAIGGLTTEISWSSDKAMICFANQIYMCSTSAALTFAQNAATWSEAQIVDWITNNLQAEYL